MIKITRSTTIKNFLNKAINIGSRSFLIVLFLTATHNFFITPLLAQEPSTKSPPPICQQLEDKTAQTKCQTCIGDDYNKPQGFWTAVGCIPTAPADAVKAIFNLALGLGGIFILIQILLGAFGLITSSGNPAAIQKARSRIIDSVIALLFVVFSVAIVQLIGIDIFKLPGMT